MKHSKKKEDGVQDRLRPSRSEFPDIDRHLQEHRSGVAKDEFAGRGGCGHYDIGWHITGTTGVFGAATAVGKELKLQIRVFAHFPDVFASDAASITCWQRRPSSNVAPQGPTSVLLWMHCKKCASI